MRSPGLRRVGGSIVRGPGRGRVTTGAREVGRRETGSSTDPAGTAAGAAGAPTPASTGSGAATGAAVAFSGGAAATATAVRGGGAAGASTVVAGGGGASFSLPAARVSRFLKPDPAGSGSGS